MNLLNLKENTKMISINQFLRDNQSHQCLFFIKVATISTMPPKRSRQILWPILLRLNLSHCVILQLQYQASPSLTSLLPQYLWQVSLLLTPTAITTTITMITTIMTTTSIQAEWGMEFLVNISELIQLLATCQASNAPLIICTQGI